MQSTIWTDHKHKSRHACFSSWTGTIHCMMLISGRMEKKYLQHFIRIFSVSLSHKHVSCCKGKPCPCTDPVWGFTSERWHAGYGAAARGPNHRLYLRPLWGLYTPAIHNPQLLTAAPQRVLWLPERETEKKKSCPLMFSHSRWICFLSVLEMYCRTE